jgi:hypothetical protein
VEFLEHRLAPASTPIPTNPTVTSITAITAILGGTIIDTPPNNGGLAIQKRGVVLSTTASTDATLQIGLAGVTEVDTPAYAPSGAFLLTVGPLTPNTKYYFRAFATNGTLPPTPFLTGYTNILSFTTNSGRAQENRILMPGSTVSQAAIDSYSTDDPDWAALNSVLFFQPAKGQIITYFSPDPTINGTTVPVPTIPLKQITFTNNLNQTVYPFLRDTASTVDPIANKMGPSVYQGEYDPIDQLDEEYRGYIGYTLNGQNYLGLLPGMTITINVPLVFWDGARGEIATDGTYLLNNLKVGDTTTPDPFQYFAFNSDGTPTAKVALPALSSSGGGAGVTGMVMWYRQGLNNQGTNTNQPAQQAKAPSSDAPAQLIEWTMRDPVLSTLNKNIDQAHAAFGETHANINYDVSYVDSMALPVAMEALDVPVPVQTLDPLDPRVPNPGPSLPYGWLGAPQSFPEFQAALNSFLQPNPSNNDGIVTNDVNGLGTYFGLIDPNKLNSGYHGWTQFSFPAASFPTGNPLPLKVASGQDALSDSPESTPGNFVHPSSYDGPVNNHYLLTSGGTTAVNLLGTGSAYSDGSTTLYLVANTAAGQQNLEQQLQLGMAVTNPQGSTGPAVPSNTTVLSYGPNGSNQFTFVTKTFGKQTDTVLEVQLNNIVQASGSGQFPNPTYGYNYTRTPTDYVSDALVSLWYTWANYYVTHVQSTPYPNLAGHALADPSDPTFTKDNNVIHLDHAVTGLQPGMIVTGSATSGILPTRAYGTGVTTIESIDSDDQTIHLSQAVTHGGSGTYSFSRPTMDPTQHAVVGYDPVTGKLDIGGGLLANFDPKDNEVSGVPDVLEFAQNVYQMLSLMSQIQANAKVPASVQILYNVIGGSVTNADLRGDTAFHHIEVAYRTKIKSLLRGVNDFNKQTDQQTQWYPKPAAATGGQSFNVYNLDPFVWFVHAQMGLSGYGFSLDDDAADISGNFSTKLGISIGGLNGVPNHFEWSLAAPYGPVTGTATVVPAEQVAPYPYLAKFPPYVFFSATAYNGNENIPGANLISNAGVRPNTSPLNNGPHGGFYYAFVLTDLTTQPAPPPAPVPTNQLEMPPLVSETSYPFTLLGPGAFNTSAGSFTVPGGLPPQSGPYMTSLQDVVISAGSTLHIQNLLGSLTSYTQQYEELSRVSIVATPDSDSNYHPTPQFIRNVPLPGLDTIVNGSLDADRVDIVDGRLSGTGTIQGSVNVLGPGSGYDNAIVLKAPTPTSPTPDQNFNNPNNKVLGTNGGSLVAGTVGAAAGSGTPGKLTVTGDVSLFGASFAAYAKGDAAQGSDYSWLSSDGKVDLGSSQLNLSLIGYTPRLGHSLTIITAAKGMTGQFSQGNSIKVNGFRFNITYNANSVVLTYAPSFGAPPPAPPPPPPPLAELVITLYQDLLGREPEPSGLTEWVQFLDSGVPAAEVEHDVWVSPEFDGRQVDGFYATYLHRAADPAGRASWIAALSAGLSETDAARLFMTSPEYTLSHPDEVSFVSGLYADVLGRSPDASGLNSWVGFARRGLGRAVIADAFLHSLEADLRTVTGYYAEFLGRAPDAVGLEAWLGLLQSRLASREQVAQAFLASDEFFAVAANGEL